MSTSPVPLIVQPSFNWAGNDGNWSTFRIKVGTPPQSFEVFPSIVGDETWIISPDFCTAFPFEGCAASRGVQLVNGSQTAGFESNVSSTWDPVGIYELTTAQNLFGSVNGSYGLDEVFLSNGTVRASQQLVAQVANETFWLGSLPLGVQASRFGVEKADVPTLLSSLKNQSSIPSLSYGYSAGAAYRQSAGGIVIGGYDGSAASGNSSIVVPLEFAASRSLTVNLRSLIATSTLQGTQGQDLGDHGLNMSIDSSVSQIWLPTAVCDRMADLLGLTYDASTDLYIVNSTMHAQLVNLNPDFTFTLAANGTSHETVDLILPYAAFDLQVGVPTYENNTNYFPIRRAVSEDQYVLGRTLLQEAYLIVDWERRNFTFGPITPQNGVSTHNIVPIQSLGNPQPSHLSGLGAGVTAGIVVGVLAGIAILCILAWLLWRRGRQKKRKAAPVEADSIPVKGSYPAEKDGESNLAEMSSEERKELPATGVGSIAGTKAELQDTELRAQLMSSPVYELPGHLAVDHELEGNTPRQAEAKTWSF